MVSAMEKWRAMVEAEHAQTERLRDLSPPGSDFWKDRAKHFRLDPRRTDDPLVHFLSSMLRPEDTLLDVGAGAGRLGLPLALRCQHVTAVEPSSSMASALREDAEYYKIGNVSVVQARWEEAEVEACDIVLCAHVLYTVKDVGRFLQKMTSKARREVWVVLFQEPPQMGLYPLWRMVHGEDRLGLPSLPELREVLGEMGIEARHHHLPPRSSSSETVGSREEAHEALRSRMFVAEGSAKDRRLGRVLEEALEETEGGYRLRWRRSLAPVVTVWRADASASTD
jgi:SAM-dependent methyltransferase